ncbi:transposase [Streptomyces sp. NPDC007883]|uniref:transposase n=1 Tax=Streptomyces sp. NPDC007883 TaxID=3155116 RepID=UPI00340D47BF
MSAVRGAFSGLLGCRGVRCRKWESYPPKSWTWGRDHCKAAKIPANRDLTTKGDLAKAMIQRALASPLPITWATADSAYGQQRRLRRMLEEAGAGCGLAVSKPQPVPAPHRPLHRAPKWRSGGPFDNLDSRVRARPRAGTLPPSDLVLHTGSATPGVGH